jgi:hypothetical protein
LRRTVEHSGRRLPVAALLTDDWMMGAVVGLERRWEQHYPATIHWRMGEGDTIGWVRVHGESGASGKIEGERLVLTLSNPEAQFPVRLQVEAPSVRPEMFARDVWDLPGMKLRVDSPLGKATVQPVDDRHVGRVLELRWAVPDRLPRNSVVLVLEVIREGP